ncbi:MAG: hypothetical protein HQK54_14185 [Oligoflexales bacterium]|nr:hypothetical protein [Oligoflexales bacterium]
MSIMDYSENMGFHMGFPEATIIIFSLLGVAQLLFILSFIDVKLISKTLFRLFHFLIALTFLFISYSFIQEFIIPSFIYILLILMYSLINVAVIVMCWKKNINIDAIYIISHLFVAILVNLGITMMILSYRLFFLSGLDFVKIGGVAYSFLIYFTLINKIRKDRQDTHLKAIKLSLSNEIEKVSMSNDRLLSFFPSIKDKVQINIKYRSAYMGDSYWYGLQHDGKNNILYIQIAGFKENGPKTVVLKGMFSGLFHGMDIFHGNVRPKSIEHNLREMKDHMEHVMAMSNFTNYDFSSLGFIGINLENGEGVYLGQGKIVKSFFINGGFINLNSPALKLSRQYKDGFCMTRFILNPEDGLLISGYGITEYVDIWKLNYKELRNVEDGNELSASKIGESIIAEVEKKLGGRDIHEDICFIFIKRPKFPEVNR